MVFQVKSHNTAIARRKRSLPAKHVVEFLKSENRKLNSLSILDWGCGRGRDLQFFKKSGFNRVSGYDPFEKFGFSHLPRGKYDIITLTYVLNVIPTKEKRIQAIRDSLKYLKDDGLMFISVRSKNKIERQAHIKDWDTFSDGYITSQSRKTFQAGIPRKELIDYLEKCGLSIGKNINVNGFTILCIEK